MSTASTPTPAPNPAPAPSAGHRRALVNGSRTALVMLLVAAAVLAGLGVLSLARVSPDQGDWLRSLFGKVFGTVALGLAAILGVPAIVGLWAMAGATAEGAVPALSERARRVVAGLAAATVVLTVFSRLVGGSGPLVLNLGIVGIVALASGGLAGAAVFSPHRWRSIVSAIGAVLVGAGVLAVIAATPG